MTSVARSTRLSRVWSEALAAEAAASGIKVLIVEPGPFQTSFNRCEHRMLNAANRFRVHTPRQGQ